MAKGLSSGCVPIAAMALGRRVGDAVFHAEKEYTHGVTYAGHPLVGEVRTCGLIGCVELCSDKERHVLFEPAGQVGLLCRDRCVENGLVMRAIRDGMVLAPPLV